MTDDTLDQRLRALIQSSSNQCFGCSPWNEHGLRLNVEESDGWVHCNFVPHACHQGWEGVVHGGILATLLDEVMGYALFFRGLKCVTARMELRYRAAVNHGDSLQIRARIIRETRKTADIEAQVMRNASIVTEGLGRFVKLGVVLPNDRQMTL